MARRSSRRRARETPPSTSLDESVGPRRKRRVREQTSQPASHSDTDEAYNAVSSDDEMEAVIDIAVRDSEGKKSLVGTKDSTNRAKSLRHQSKGKERKRNVF